MKARVMTTLKCVRACPGCVNTTLTPDDYTEIDSIYDVLDYDELILTGGEPFVDPQKVLELVSIWKDKNPRKRLTLYTSYFADQPEWTTVLRLIDGLNYTLHAECTEDDVMFLKILSQGVLPNMLVAKQRKTPLDQPAKWRLDIDARVYDRFELGSGYLDLSVWHVVRKLQWKNEGNCPLPDGERLFLLRS